MGYDLRFVDDLHLRSRRTIGATEVRSVYEIHGFYFFVFNLVFPFFPPGMLIWYHSFIGLAGSVLMLTCDGG